jgi:hypothetical protein
MLLGTETPAAFLAFTDGLLPAKHARLSSTSPSLFPEKIAYEVIRTKTSNVVEGRRGG